MKTIYVIANTQSVELFVNGKSHGVNSQPANGYVFAFPDVEFAPGSLKAVGRNDGKSVAQEELTTAGPPAQIKLTPIAGPQGFQADGQDAALIDVEVVDAKGQRCPTDDDKVDFTIAGPGIWRGGYNSGKIDSTNNLYLNTECGINRVSVRSTFSAGTITVTASRPGLKSAQIKIVVKPVKIVDGLATFMPQHLRGPAGRFRDGLHPEIRGVAQTFALRRDLTRISRTVSSHGARSGCVRVGMPAHRAQRAVRAILRWKPGISPKHTPSRATWASRIRGTSHVPLCCCQLEACGWSASAAGGEVCPNAGGAP